MPLNPTDQQVSYPRERGGSVVDRWNPTVGNRVLLFSGEYEPADVAAANALLVQLKALAVHEFSEDWVASANPGMVPLVDIRGTVSKKGRPPQASE